MKAPTDLLLIATLPGNGLQPALPDLLGAAEIFTAAGGGTVRLLLAGSAVADRAAEWAAASGLDFFTLEAPGLALPDPALTAALISRALPQVRPRHIGLPHTIQNCQIAAILASETAKPVTTGVEDIMRSDGQLLFRRALFNGKLTATRAVAETGTVFTFMAGEPSEIRKSLKKTGTVTPLPEQTLDSTVQTLSVSRPPDNEETLEEANAIVSIGMGMGKEENLPLAHTVAGILKNSALAGSRPACDAGWLPYSRQVGETGRQVAPELYLACGISGARQHLAGIKNARLVIGINTDPGAAIFQRADFGVVEDAARFLAALLEKHRKRFQP